jgi:protein-disulfide isomerase
MNLSLHNYSATLHPVRSFLWLCTIGSLMVFGGCASQTAKPSTTPSKATVASENSCFLKGIDVPYTSAKDPSWGKAQAPVTIVEFYDFQCPYCQQVVPTLKKIQNNYGEDKVRLVFKHRPIDAHEEASDAALVSQGVFELGGTKAFMSFYLNAFSTDAQLGPQLYTQWIKSSGVNDWKALVEGVKKGRFAAKVIEDEKLADAVGAQGIPTFIVNGKMLTGAQDYHVFEQVIDDELTGIAGNKNANISCLRSQSIWSQGKGFGQISANDGIDSRRWKVPVATSPSKGGKDALVTIVMFSDYQCPYCREMQGVLQQMFDRYGNKLRLIHKEFMLEDDESAQAASILALEARRQKGDAAYWKASELLFAASEFDEQTLKGIAIKLKLNLDEWQSSIKKQRFQSTIIKDLVLAKRLGVHGIPSFFVNGRSVTGAWPVDEFQALLEGEMKKAEALVKNGTRPEHVYDALQKQADSP